MKRDADAEEERFLRFGVKHECTCTADVAEGKLAVVPECTVRLIGDLFDALERTNLERDGLRDELESTKAELATRKAADELGGDVE